ncbi:hypothetical protein BpHYR1_041565 [Brachionus plicatilis]|uniref:Uncharacterized protein n=1 Tax=Brachionus plicatilis TaxID=10195 RepID=A0A3M7SRP0_BRAPC|nr:hypothetical protein BpHYR1_041565 [Brachionus plicatilis]
MYIMSKFRFFLDILVIIQYSHKNLLITSLSKEITGVLNSMKTHDIKPRANSLGMILYNFWVHIAQTRANLVLVLLKIFILPITPRNFSFQISPKIFDWSCFWYVCWIHIFGKFDPYIFI